MLKRHFLITCLVITGVVIFGCDRTPSSVSGPDRTAGQPNITQQLSNPGNASNQQFDVVVGPNQSIAAAVQQANSGDKVLVNGGTHAEQVLINKDLTLVGKNEATIVQPQNVQSYKLAESGRPWAPLIFAYGGSIVNNKVSGSETVDVTVRGFIIDGESSPASNLTAVLFRNVHSSGGITDVTVKNMDVSGNGSTFGLIAYGDSKVTFAHNTVRDIERGGIGANGDGGAHPAPRVVIRNNKIVGSDNPKNAPNLIQVGYGAEATILNNTLREAHYGGSLWKASGILIFETDGVRIHGNTVKDADRAIAVSSWGFFLKSADRNIIQGNRISGSDGGIVVQSKSWNDSTFSFFSNMNSTAINNKIVRNTVTGTGSGIGIHVYAEDNSMKWDAQARNNKVINNQVRNFGTAIVNKGSASKIQANNHPFNP